MGTWQWSFDEKWSLLPFIRPPERAEPEDEEPGPEFVLPGPPSKAGKAYGMSYEDAEALEHGRAGVH